MNEKPTSNVRPTATIRLAIETHPGTIHPKTETSKEADATKTTGWFISGCENFVAIEQTRQ